MSKKNKDSQVKKVKSIIDTINEILEEDGTNRKERCLKCGKNTGYDQDFCSEVCYKKWLGLK